MILLQNQFSVTFLVLIKVHLKWNFCLNHDIITEPIFRGFFSINKSPFKIQNQFSVTFLVLITVHLKLNFSLNHDIFAEPIFLDFFSINKSPLQSCIKKLFFVLVYSLSYVCK